MTRSIIDKNHRPGKRVFPAPTSSPVKNIGPIQRRLNSLDDQKSLECWLKIVRHHCHKAAVSRSSSLSSSSSTHWEGWLFELALVLFASVAFLLPHDCIQYGVVRMGSYHILPSRRSGRHSCALIPTSSNVGHGIDSCVFVTWLGSSQHQAWDQRVMKKNGKIMGRLPTNLHHSWCRSLLFLGDSTRWYDWK